jgi:site-specific DNA recombinase
MTNRAALYLRSSKDRSDISPDAQRRALQEFAAAKGLVVVTEFLDVVESAKDDDRPGFQSMVRAVQDRNRGWERILVLDTSRLARRRYIGIIFEHEAARVGVKVAYKSIPDSDPITEMLLKSMLQAMDEWHSLTSRAKGLAGMAENVRQGWRAGGKAPRGYKLEYHATGAIREGAPVLKSKLAPSDDAPAVARYLKARAAGIARGRVVRDQLITWPAASLNDMEWLALTYAGHTVWNVTNERQGGTHLAGTKRKPRAEWLVQRDTHPALITADEAESLLAQLEDRRWTRVRDTERAYLLTGFLRAPGGAPWSGEWDSKMKAPLYRLGKGRRISARRVDEAVLGELREILTSDEGARYVTAAMQVAAGQPVDARAIAGLETRIHTLTGKVGNLVDLIADAGDHERAAYRRAIETAEGERAELIAKLSTMRGQADQVRAAKRFTENDARRLLRLLFDQLQASQDAGNTETTKAALGGLVDSIELDESCERCHINFRIGAAVPAPDTGVMVATLRGAEAAPVRFVREVRIVAKRNGTSG